MGNKGYYEIIKTYWIFALLVFFIIIVGSIATTENNRIKNQIKELQQTVEQQDQEILELQTKNALLKDEIASLEIFDCTFKKFPELRDQLLIDTFKGELPESNSLDEGSENDGAF